jgi:hypothetical protein
MLNTSIVPKYVWGLTIFVMETDTYKYYTQFGVFSCCQTIAKNEKGLKQPATETIKQHEIKRKPGFRFWCYFLYSIYLPWLLLYLILVLMDNRRRKMRS